MYIIYEMINSKFAQAEVNKDLVDNFKVRFNLETLVSFANAEESSTKQAFIIGREQDLKNMGVNNPQVVLKRREDYEACYPETIKYLTDNVFLSDQGAYYVNSMNEDGVVMPKEIQDKAFNKFLMKFPHDIKTYFEKHYLTTYHIVVSPTDPKRFHKNGIHYLNLLRTRQFNCPIMDERNSHILPLPIPILPFK